MSMVFVTIVFLVYACPLKRVCVAWPLDKVTPDSQMHKIIVTLKNTLKKHFNIIFSGQADDSFLYASKRVIY